MRTIIFLAALALFLTPIQAFAACPKIGVAPRTGNPTAEEFAKSGKYSLDDQGILLFDYGASYDGLGKFHNPYFISNYANILYKEYLESSCQNEDALKKFLLQADWFVKTVDREKGISVWRYPFAQPKFDLKAGWISGIGQSRIAGVLYRAFVLTGNRVYREIAEEAMQAYKYSPAEGGVAIHEDDVTWMEEAANKGGASYKILNGHVTALAGILDFYQITGEKEWKDLFDRGVVAVRRDIAQFDAGFLSYYSLASPKDRVFAPRRGYNALHVHQLLWLYDETSDSVFLEWASRFQAYEMDNYKFTAKGSIDPKGHGPEEVAAYYGNRYWSHTDLPTWLEVEADAPTVFSGMAVHGNGQKATPRDFKILARRDGVWLTVVEVKENAEMRRIVEFPAPVRADALRVVFDSTNGKKNVALQAVMPIRKDPKFWPIVNACNYRFSSDSYNFDRALDNDPKTVMRIFCPGWIVLPVGDSTHLTINAEAAKGTRVELSFSDDLKTWTKPTKISLQDADQKIANSKFMKISFGAEVKRIASIQLR